MPVVGHPLELRVRLPRYRCDHDGYPREVFAHDSSRLARPGWSTTRRCAQFVMRRLAIEKATVAAVARELGRSWDTVNSIAVAATQELLLSAGPARLDGVRGKRGRRAPVVACARRRRRRLRHRGHRPHGGCRGSGAGAASGVVALPVVRPGMGSDHLLVGGVDLPAVGLGHVLADLEDGEVPLDHRRHERGDVAHLQFDDREL